MPTGAQRTSRNNSVKGTDPSKKAPSKKKTTPSKEKFERGQQLSDKQASLVAKGKKTYAQARKSDSIADSRVRTKTIGTRTSGGSQNTISKTKHKKVTGFKLDKNGKKKAY